jgi:YbbR domain-containing protein
MREFLRNLVFGDWLLKIFSLALAILTWLAVSFSLQQKPGAVPGKPDLSEQPYYDVPITVVSGSADVHDFKTRPSEVDVVTVQGEKTVIQKIERRFIRLQVDLTGATLTNGLKRRVEVITPPGVTCMRVLPEEVEIVLPPVPETKIESP